MARDELELIAAWSRDLDEALGEILASTTTMTLATSHPTLGPHAAPVYFAADTALTCCFLSDPETRHGQDLARDAQVAAAIYPAEPDWRRLRGLQLTGRVRRLAAGDPDHANAWSVYAARYPIVADVPDAVARSVLYTLTPDWIRLVDNRRGFGYRRAWRLAEGGG